MKETTMSELTLLDPRKIRRDHVVDVDLGDGTCIRCRREDMTMLVFEGRVPMPLLTAVQKMIDLPNATPVERVEALGSTHAHALADVLRQHAAKVAIQPVITMTDDGNPDHLPVEFLSVTQLMTIWQTTAVIPRVSPSTAATFRDGAGLVDADAVPDVDAVPPAAVPMDLPVESPEPDAVAVGDPVVRGPREIERRMGR